MIDFKNKDELPMNVVICGSLAVLVIAVACKQLLPAPQAPTLKQAAALRSKVNKSTDAMKKELESVKVDLATQTWPGRPEDVGPVALKQVNALLQNRHLKLTGFHSQKPIEESNITLIPFIVSVDGGFPSVVSFTKDLEKAGTKLVVNLFQVTNADQTTDKVTASIGIVAYQLPQPPAAAPAPATPAAPTKTTKSVKNNA